MKIVQWNTHHGGVGSDGKLDTARIASAILAHIPDADVISFNEVEQNDGYGKHDCVDIWCKTLGPSWTGVSVNLSGVISGNGISNAILSRLPMSMPTAKGFRNGRAAISVVINGVNIISTHLDNESANVRCTQLFQLMKWAPALTPGKLVIAGDWNCHDGNVEQAPLQAFFKDAWKVAVANKTATQENGGTNGNTRSSRIDAIFFQAMDLVSCDVPDMKMDGVLPSDHSPVVATFK